MSMLNDHRTKITDFCHTAIAQQQQLFWGFSLEVFLFKWCRANRHLGESLLPSVEERDPEEGGDPEAEKDRRARACEMELMEVYNFCKMCQEDFLVS